MRETQMPALRPIVNWCAPFALLAGGLYVAYQFATHWGAPTVDIRYFWLAGEFWAAGEDPYSAAYAQRAAAQFDAMDGAAWYYPPNWLPIAAFLSLFDPLTASRLWLALNAALLLGASALNVAAFQRMQGRTALAGDSPFAALLRSLSPRTLFLLHAGFMATTQAAGTTLAFGQSSMIVYFGASLLVFAAAGKRDIAGGAGLALMMLKPQIGLLAVAALALSPYGRRVIVLGAIASFLMAAPALAVTPVSDILAGLFSGASQYQIHQYNAPAAMTGLRHLVWAAGGPDLGTAFYLALTLAAVCAAGLAGRRRAQPLRTLDNLTVAFAATLFLAPLHVYDFAIIGAGLFYAASLRAPLGAIAVAAAIALWRAGNLLQPPALAELSPAFFPGALYATLGAGAMLAAMVAASMAVAASRPVPVRPSAEVIPFTAGRHSSAS